MAQKSKNRREVKQMKYINIALRPSTHKSLLLFKIMSKVENLDDAVKLLLKPYSNIKITIGEGEKVND